MHVALIVMEFPPDPIGGIGSFALDLAQGLSYRGHVVSVIVPNIGAQTTPRRNLSYLTESFFEPMPRVSVHRWSYHPAAWSRWRPGVLWHRRRLRQKLLALHRDTPFDVLETQDLYGPLPFGGIYPVPTVVRHHSSATFYDKVSGSSGGDSLTYWLERQTARRTRHHVAVSSFAGEGVQQCFGLKHEDVTTIPYGINTDLFKPACPEGIGTVPGRIVFVNSIAPRKGVRQLCVAFDRVLKQIPSASLQLIGRTDHVDNDGLRYADVCLDGLSAHTRSRIEFTGPLDRRTEIVPALQSASICCFPSQLETFGIAPLEAMAVGKPVIYMHHGPGPEIISHGVNGLLCDTSSPEDIADKLIELLKDPERARRLGHAARIRSLDFSSENWIDKNLRYYDSVLGLP